jgi:hypothetical protein
MPPRAQSGVLALVVVTAAQQIVNAPNVPAFVSSSGGLPGGVTRDMQCNVSGVLGACDTGNFTINSSTHQMSAASIALTNLYSSTGMGDSNSLASLSFTAPTVSAGFGTSPTVTAGSRAVAFEISVGSSPGTTGTITLPTAATGWVCFAQNMTAAIVVRQTARSTTSATFTFASTPTAADKIVGHCAGF